MKKLPIHLSLVLAVSGCPAERAPDLTTRPDGSGAATDHPPVDPDLLAQPAEAQRLSVEQLRRSLPVVMGRSAAGEDVTWRDGGALGLDTYADSLGEADYVILTADDLEPSPLYVKFMDDAARSVCHQAIEVDYGGGSGGERTLVRHTALDATYATDPEGVDANLRYLKLRMHGQKVEDDDVDTIAPLRTLFIDAASSPREGWRAVCVALLTAPDFHLY